MELARAQEIVTAINQRALALLDLVAISDLKCLRAVGLTEMIEATAAVRAENRRREEEAKGTGKPYSIAMVPADRLIAAVYSLENFEPSNEAIAITRHDGFGGDIRVLGVLLQDLDHEEPEE